MPLNRDSRVTLLTFFVAAGLSILLGWLVSLNSERIELDLLETLARDEVEELSSLLERDPAAPLPRTNIVHVWVEGHWDNAPLPWEFSTLTYGTHHEVAYQGDVYHILRTRMNDGDTIIAIDIDSFEAHETIIQLLLIVAVLVGPIATVMMALYLRGRLNPVVEMAQLVARLDPSDRGVRLSEQISDGEMGVIAAAFDRYQERLDRFVERERAFSAAASHELRTPLAVLVAGSEVLAEAESLPDYQAMTLNRMRSAALQMTDLLNGLMWLARESETPPLERLDLREATRKVIENYQTLLQRNGLRLETNFTGTPVMQLPRGHYEMVLSNLLNNAITYTPRDGLIEISCEQGLLVVKDSGRGIESRYLHRIFDRDFRGQDSPGAGLGLYLCQRLCQYHGWRITVNSEVGRGTKVIVDMTPKRRPGYPDRGPV